MQPPFRARALGIHAPLLKVELAFEEPHLYPACFVVVEPNALVVGDDFGMRVASYPYREYRLLRRSTPAFRFFAVAPTGDFTLSAAIPDVDYPADAFVPT